MELLMEQVMIMIADHKKVFLHQGGHWLLRWGLFHEQRTAHHHVRSFPLQWPR